MAAFRAITEIVGIELNGEKLPLEPRLAKLFYRLLQEGQIEAPADSTRGGKFQISMSQLRAALVEIGLPYRIIHQDGKYYLTQLVTPGLECREVDERTANGRSHASSCSLDRV